MSDVAVSLLLLSLDQILEKAGPEQRVDLATALRERIEKILPTQPLVGIDSESSDPLRTEPVKVVAAYLKLCDESVRKLIHQDRLTICRKGTGRNYEVLWTSVLSYKRRMLGGYADGGSVVEQEAREMAAQMGRQRR